MATMDLVFDSQPESPSSDASSPQSCLAPDPWTSTQGPTTSGSLAIAGQTSSTTHMLSSGELADGEQEVHPSSSLSALQSPLRQTTYPIPLPPSQPQQLSQLPLAAGGDPDSAEWIGSTLERRRREIAMSRRASELMADEDSRAPSFDIMLPPRRRSSSVALAAGGQGGGGTGSGGREKPRGGDSSRSPPQKAPSGVGSPSHQGGDTAMLTALSSALYSLPNVPPASDLPLELPDGVVSVRSSVSQRSSPPIVGSASGRYKSPIRDSMSPATSPSAPAKPASSLAASDSHDLSLSSLPPGSPLGLSRSNSRSSLLGRLSPPMRPRSTTYSGTDTPKSPEAMALSRGSPNRGSVRLYLHLESGCTAV